MAENETMTATVDTGAETAGDAAAAGVVDPQTEPAAAAENAENQQQQAAEGTSIQQPSENKKAQSAGKNTYYASLRKKADAYDGVSGGIMGLARAKGLQPKDAAEAIEMLEADAKGVTLEVYRKEKTDAEAQLEQQVRESNLYKELEQRAESDRADAEAYRVNRQMQADLQAIREVDPTVESLESLGDEFKEFVASGMSGLNAYYAVKGRQAVQNAAMPPVTGELGGATDNDRVYTSEELDRLTDKDLDDPKVFEKALRSLTKLK